METPWSNSILAKVFTYVHIILVAAMWVCMYNKCMLTECRKVKSKSNTAAKNEPVPSFLGYCTYINIIIKLHMYGEHVNTSLIWSKANLGWFPYCISIIICSDVILWWTSVKSCNPVWCNFTEVRGFLPLDIWYKEEWWFVISFPIEITIEKRLSSSILMFFFLQTHK